MKEVRTKDNCYMWSSKISYSSKCTTIKEKGMKMITYTRGTPKLKVCGKCQTRMSHQKLRLNITSKGEKLMMAQIDRKLDQMVEHVQSEVGKSSGDSFTP